MEFQHVNEILPNLYLGDRVAATDIKTLQTLKISHILSLDMEPLPEFDTRNLTTKLVKILGVGALFLQGQYFLQFLESGVCISSISNCLDSGVYISSNILESGVHISSTFPASGVHISSTKRQHKRLILYYQKNAKPPPVPEF